MVPVGTTAMDWWCPAISLCWRCRPTARSSIQWSGFGTICAATGSPTRCFEASPTSWTPARWRGTGSPPTPAWSARSARSPGLRLRPLYSWRLLCGLRSKTHSCPEISGDPYYFRAKAYQRAADRLAALVEPLDRVIAENRLRELPGVGETIADIVTKLHRTGTHPLLEKLRKDVPEGVLDMLSIPGLKR